MIQITPQMRILVAVESVDFRKGIDSLAELLPAEAGCRSIFRVICLCSAAGEQPLLRCWSMTGRGFFGSPRSVYPKDASAALAPG